METRPHIHRVEPSSLRISVFVQLNPEWGGRVRVLAVEILLWLGAIRNLHYIFLSLPC